MAMTIGIDYKNKAVTGKHNKHKTITKDIFQFCRILQQT